MTTELKIKEDKMSEQMDILWTLPDHIRAKAQGEITDIKLIRCLYKYVKELVHEKKTRRKWDDFFKAQKKSREERELPPEETPYPFKDM